jgi:hypothetical protein
MKEGIYRGRILQSYVLFWVIMFIFEIPVYDDNGNNGRFWNRASIVFYYW